MITFSIIFIQTVKKIKGLQEEIYSFYTKNDLEFLQNNILLARILLISITSDLFPQKCVRDFLCMNIHN